MSGIANASSNPEPVKAICDKFTKVFQLFGACDKDYNGKAVDEAGIQKLGMGIL